MAIAFVQNIGTNNTTGATVTSLAITVPAGGVAAGDSVIVSVVTSGGLTVSSVTDTAGNTYTIDKTALNGQTTTIAAAHNVTVLTSGNTITANFSGACHAAMSAAEFSGLATSSTLDKTANGTGTSTTPATAATATTAQADELLIGAISYATGPTTFAVGSGYTVLQEAVSTGTVRGICPEYRIVSATGAYVADGTLAPSRQWAAAIATYKAAAAPGQPIALRHTLDRTGARSFGRGIA